MSCTLFPRMSPYSGAVLLCAAALVACAAGVDSDNPDGYWFSKVPSGSLPPANVSAERSTAALCLCLCFSFGVFAIVT